MITLREYQRQACRDTMSLFRSVRSVCLVSPTGSGKTVTGTALVAAFVRRSKRVLFVAHRRELITQSERVLRQAIGSHAVGVIMPGHISTPSCPVQVGSIQTMLSQGFPDDIDFLVLDECHHYPADEWGKVHAQYPAAKVLGLTATPERRDGRPLGDMFDDLVVAAQHSTLLEDGFLVPCRIVSAGIAMGSNEVSHDPLTAYRDFASGSLAFGFASLVEQCEILAHRFTEAGFPSAVIECNTPKRDRDRFLDEFKHGILKVLWNVYALTEGVDVPQASTIIIARKMEHCGMFMQSCGRVLRPFPGKTEALIIDLVGATLKHGSPVEDREYSLSGDAMKRTSPVQLRVCPQCGATEPAWQSKCPVCGFEPPKVDAPELKIYSHALREVFAGMKTPADAKDREYQRLRALGRERGWSLYFVQKEYAKLFGEKPVIRDASAEEREEYLSKAIAQCQEKGWKPGRAAVLFKQTFGSWPTEGRF
jgi:DNA repair protein RadD